MNTDFVHRTLPVVGKRVLRLGLAPSFGIDAQGVEWALGGGGLQYVFWTPRMKTDRNFLSRTSKVPGPLSSKPPHFA